MVFSCGTRRPSAPPSSWTRTVSCASTMERVIDYETSSVSKTIPAEVRVEDDGSCATSTTAPYPSWFST